MFNILNKLKVFFEEPTKEFNVREFARLLKISPATASKELKQFTKDGFLKVRNERNLILYKANLDNFFYKDLKIYYNVQKIKETGLLEKINQEYLKPTVVMFGSCAFGMDTETSDVDLLVISENTKIINLKKFENKFGKTIQLMMVKNLKELKNKNLINNVINGITLQGKLRWT